MKKALYIPLFISLLFSISVQAQEKEGFMNRAKGFFSPSYRIGSYTFKNGAVYTGELRKRRPEGSGKTLYLNNDIYNGEYKKGQREGYGVYILHTGEKYAGNWVDDIQQGDGEYFFLNNNRYSGTWENGFQ